MSLKRFSVLICTYNQSESLATVLDFLNAQSVVHAEQFEVVVVNNNSKDRTEDVCLKFQEKSQFSFNYIFEGRQGLSTARNTGVSASKGDVIIFTDDDAKIPGSWLQTIANTYNIYDADCVYGKILIDWECRKPDWYEDRYKRMYVALDYGDKIINVEDQHKEFFGKNFSVKKNIIEELGGFNKNLGRVGDRLFVGEETLIFKYLINKNKKVIYNPDVYLSHMIKDHELEVAHLKRYYLDIAHSTYYMATLNSNKRFLGRPLYIAKMIIKFFSKLPFDFGRCVLKPSDQEWRYLSLEVGQKLLLVKLWLTKGE